MNANELADELCFAEMDSDEIETWAKNARDMLRQQQAEIERLIGSKPITYGMLTFCKNCGEQNPYQSKTLTDEEIQQAIDSIDWNQSNVLIRFARAILRKAQEK